MADETPDEPRPDDYDEMPETPSPEDENANDPRLAVNTVDDGNASGVDVEDASDPEDVDPDVMTPRVASERNQQIVGQLTLHYAIRDVRIPVDGDAAMRIMKAHRTNRGMGDLLLPPISSARDGWVTLDADEPLAISWLPELPLPEARMAIDPAI